MPTGNSRFDALTELRVIENCPENWNRMRGDDQVRFCSRCLKSVYNISNMDRQAAVELIEKSEGHICVRYYKRPDGMIMTADCPSRMRAKVKLYSLLAPIAAVFGIVFTPAAAMGARRADPLTEAKHEVAQMTLLTDQISGSTDSNERAELVEERNEAKSRIALDIHRFFHGEK